MNCPEEIASKDRKRLEDTEDRRNRQRLKAVEELLLQEFDQAWAELDRAKANPAISVHDSADAASAAKSRDSPRPGV